MDVNLSDAGRIANLVDLARRCVGPSIGYNKREELELIASIGSSTLSTINACIDIKADCIIEAITICGALVEDLNNEAVKCRDALAQTNGAKRIAA